MLLIAYHGSDDAKAAIQHAGETIKADGIRFRTYVAALNRYIASRDSKQFSDAEFEDILVALQRIAETADGTLLALEMEFAKFPPMQPRPIPEPPGTPEKT